VKLGSAVRAKCLQSPKHLRSQAGIAAAMPSSAGGHERIPRCSRRHWAQSAYCQSQPQELSHTSSRFGLDQPLRSPSRMARSRHAPTTTVGLLPPAIPTSRWQDAEETPQVHRGQCPLAELICTDLRDIRPSTDSGSQKLISTTDCRVYSWVSVNGWGLVAAPEDDLRRANRIHDQVPRGNWVCYKRLVPVWLSLPVPRRYLDDLARVSEPQTRVEP
jgi:hypothetical protein